MNKEIVGNADIEENTILELDKNILAILLQDKTTKKNIIWATDDYLDLGPEYASAKEITIELITGEHGGVIKPRSVKTREEQAVRVRNMAEVFTPTWICNKQANLTDDGWFVEDKGFNVEKENAWEVNEGKVEFINKDKDAPNGWMHYLSRKCLEITCGEAPYLVSRYDTVTGDLIPLYSRIGLIDRKMRIINEKIRNFKDKNKSKKRWLMLAKRALHSTYGFEWSGDNVLLARENILASIREYYEDKFKEELDILNLEKFAEIIAWNIWQMDGLKCVVPNSCCECKKKLKLINGNIFDKKEFSAKTLSKSKSYCDIIENEVEECQGCVKDNLHLHNGLHCKVKNWANGKIYSYEDLVDDQRGMFSMSKEFKFDVVIGNPPYQDKTIGENKTYQPPVYHKFLDAAYLVCDKVVMIHPARFLFDAGSTPHEWNHKMLHNKNFTILHYEPDSSKIFTNTDIKGGIAISCYDRNKTFGEIDVFTPYNTLRNIMKKVTASENFTSFSTIVGGRNMYRFTKVLHEEVPSVIKRLSKGHDTDLTSNVFEKLPDVLVENYCSDECYKVLGRINNERAYRYVKKDYVVKNSFIEKYKVFMPQSSGNGGLGEAMAPSVIGYPGEITTETFLTVGSFDVEDDAIALLKYIKTKFARVLLSILKITQANTSKKWEKVPTQDFSAKSDIDWTKNINDIDKQLYKKYGLTDEEVAFIEKNVKEMD